MKKTFKTGTKRIAYVVAEVLMLIEFIIELIYGLIRLIRYGCVKGIGWFIKLMREGIYENIGYDEYLTELARNDADQAIKVNKLRSDNNEESK